MDLKETGINMTNWLGGALQTSEAD
jgi:hypothetical protein